ncbi:MAG: hypothetical protein ABJF01_05135 [bacterium]
MIRAKSTLFVLVAALLPLGSVAAQSSAPLPSMSAIRVLLAERHLNVYSDTSVNAVIIIVDTNAKYVKGLATRLDAAEVAAADSGWARFARLIDTGDGRLQADTLWTSCEDRAPAEPFAGRPIYILDGVRVDKFESMRQLAIRSLEIPGPTPHI